MEPNNMNGQGGMNGMNSAPSQPQPMQPPMRPAMPAKPASSAGAWAALAILLAVLVLGGVYFWGRRASAPDAAGIQPAQSDNLSDIEADLNATDVENVDYDLNPDNFNAS